MWQLIAAVAVLLNGVSIGPHPSMVFGTTFPTEQACNDFKNSDAGKAALAQLQALEDDQHKDKKVVITQECKVEETKA